MVTGLGAVTAVGCGRHSLAEAFRTSTTHLKEVDRSEGFHRSGGARLASQATASDLSAWLPAAAARRMSRPSRMAVAAARMALEDAGLASDQGGEDPPTMVAVSNPFGPSSITEELLAQMHEEGPVGASPALFTESVANAPAAQIALAYRARGANLTVTQRDAGTLIALGRAASEIALGRAGRAVVVTVDELTPLLHAVLDRFRALTRPDHEGREIARPFDRRRDGFLAAEGATAVVLETESAVARRGGRALARILTTSSAFDPAAPVTGWSARPTTLAGALRRQLQRAALSANDLDAVISGANGSIAGDRLEAGILRTLFASTSVPPVLTPKAVIGEHGGSVLAAAILALSGTSFGPTPGFTEVDPGLDLAPHDGRPLPQPHRLLLTSLAAGGAGAWAVFEKVA